MNVFFTALLLLGALAATATVSATAAATTKAAAGAQHSPNSPRAATTKPAATWPTTKAAATTTKASGGGSGSGSGSTTKKAVTHSPNSPRASTAKPTGTWATTKAATTTAKATATGTPTVAPGHTRIAGVLHSNTTFVDVGPAGLSAGDLLVPGGGDNSLYDENNTNVIADSRGHCVALDTSTFQCFPEFIFPTGLLFAIATYPPSGNTVGAVIGGTGAYVGARGTFTVTPRTATTQTAVFDIFF